MEIGDMYERTLPATNRPPMILMFSATSRAVMSPLVTPACVDCVAAARAQIYRSVINQYQQGLHTLQMSLCKCSARHGAKTEPQSRHTSSRAALHVNRCRARKKSVRHLPARCGIAHQRLSRRRMTVQKNCLHRQLRGREVAHRANSPRGAWPCRSMSGSLSLTCLHAGTVAAPALACSIDKVSSCWCVAGWVL